MIIFLYGPDSFRLKEKLKILKDRFIHEVDESGLNLIEVDAQKATINEINKAVNTQSFLAKKRMVVIKDIFHQRKSLQTEVLEILKNGKHRDDSERNVLVFCDEQPDKRCALFKYLAGAKFKEEFNVLKNNDLVKWIQQRVKDKKGRINWQNANLLASKSDGNLWALAGEIAKILAVKKGGELAKEDIEESPLVKIDDNIFNLCDAIANKNKKMALKLINDQLEAGVNEIYLLTMVVRQFRILILVKSELEKGIGNYRAIASGLSLHPYVVQKAIPQASKYSLEDLKKIYNKLLEIDTRLKLGESGKVLMEMFIIEI